MTKEEAKARIKQEYIEGFYEWLRDEAEMSAQEFGRKYGWGRGTKTHKDNIAGIKVYQKYINAGRYIQGWKKAGYEASAIYALHQEGFLSYTLYTNWQARQLGREDWYYISQKTAVQIYKEYKAGA